MHRRVVSAGLLGIHLHILPSGTNLNNIPGHRGPVPGLSSFLALYDPKLYIAFLKGVLEHKNTLMAAQPGQPFEVHSLLELC